MNPVHRITMIDTEINVLRMIWQSPSTTDGQSSIIIKHTTDLLKERHDLEKQLGRRVWEQPWQCNTA